MLLLFKHQTEVCPLLLTKRLIDTLAFPFGVFGFFQDFLWNNENKSDFLYSQVVFNETHINICGFF